MNLFGFFLGVHMLSVLIPMLVSYLLEPETMSKQTAVVKKLHQTSLQKLMLIGPQFPADFRTIMQSNSELRQKLEVAIKTQQSEPTTNITKTTALDSKINAPVKPSIKLKTNFGNFA